MQVPVVHPNGTSREALEAGWLAAIDAIDAAVQAVAAAAPHGRDYYPLGPDAYMVARTEHYSRLRRLREVEAELRDLCQEVLG